MTPGTPSRGTLGRDTDNRCSVTVTDRGSGVCCSYLLILTGISTIYYYIHYLPRYLFVFHTSAPLIAHFLLQMQSSIVSGVKWVTDVIYCHHSTVAVAQKVSQYFSNWYKKNKYIKSSFLAYIFRLLFSNVYLTLRWATRKNCLIAVNVD